MGLGSFLYRNVGRPIYKGTGTVKDGLGDAWNDVTGKTAAREAGNMQAQAADKAIDFQRESRDIQLEQNKPWLEAGMGALSELSGGLKSGAFDYTPEEFSYNLPNEQYNAPKFNFEEDPGYRFRQEEGMKVLQNSAAARGGLFGGATGKSLQKYGQGLASEEYGAAYDRFNNDRNVGYGQFMDRQALQRGDRSFAFGVHQDKVGAKRQSINDRFARLSALAGIGESATTRNNQATGNYGNAGADLTIQRGNAQAGSRVGQYNTQRDFIMGLGDLGVKAAGTYMGGK